MDLEEELKKYGEHVIVPGQELTYEDVHCSQDVHGSPSLSDCRKLLNEFIETLNSARKERKRK